METMEDILTEKISNTMYVADERFNGISENLPI